MFLKRCLSFVLAAGLVLPSFYGERNVSSAAVKEIVIEKDTAGNPIVNSALEDGKDPDGKGKYFYGGDPSVLVDGDTVYAYVGRDAATDSEVDRKIYNMKEYCCFSTKDMKTWKWEGPVMQVSTEEVVWARDSSSAWAAQVAKHNNKYYLYFCTWDKTSAGKQSIGVAVSDSPTGPFKDIGKPLIKGTLTTPQTNDWDDIDPTVWIEKDKSGVEHRYLAWGNSRFYVCELNDDMISVKDVNKDGKITCGTGENADIVNSTPSAFTEAPWLYRRKNEKGEYEGSYYLFYASGWRERLAYATTEDLMKGKWEYGKILMSPTATSNTNHMAVFDFQGKTYFMYHNGSQPGGNGYRRIPCVTELHFNAKGEVLEIPETASGISGTTSVLYTNSGARLEHSFFVNSAMDKKYPIRDEEIGEGIGKEEADGQWLLMAGKADKKESCVSIQSENKPGLYITAQSKTKVRMAQDEDASVDMAKKQTFRTVQGLSNEKGISFESIAYPGRYLTMSNCKLILSDGTDVESSTFYLGIDKDDSSLRSIGASIQNNQILQGDKKALNGIKKNIRLTLVYANGTSKKSTRFTVDTKAVNIGTTGTKQVVVQYTEGTIKKRTLVPVVVVVKPQMVKKLTVKASAKKKKVKIVFSWKKAAGQKYELSYGTKKSQHKKLGNVEITKKTKTYSRSAKKFKKGKKYYFHIRTYSTVNKKKKYGKYKSVGVKVK